MGDFIAALDEMRGRTTYNYVNEMVPEVEAWIMKNVPFLAAGLGLGLVDQHDGYEQVYGRLSMTDDYKRFGLGYRGRSALAQWQYKDMVRRAGSELLEEACKAFGIERGTVIHAIFTNDWKSLDELIRYHALDVAVALAVNNIAAEGKKK